MRRGGLLALMIAMSALLGCDGRRADPSEPEVSAEKISAARPAASSGHGRRIALVVGNADYDLNGHISNSEAAEAAATRAGFLPDLKNTINDARDIRQALDAVGFEKVFYAENASGEELVMKLDAFGDAVRDAGPDALVVIYYSGHGMQVEGANFLLPVGARLPRLEYDRLSGSAAQAILSRVAVPMTLVWSQLSERSGNGMNIIILDACRNNPWDPTTRGSGRRGRGLADQRVELGATLVAYSTEPGNTAYDGNPGDRNSPFTAELKTAIVVPGADVWRMFNGVSRRVELKTREWRDGAQRPWVNSVTIPENVCFAGCDGHARSVESADNGSHRPAITGKTESSNNRTTDVSPPSVTALRAPTTSVAPPPLNTCVSDLARLRAEASSRCEYRAGVCYDKSRCRNVGELYFCDTALTSLTNDITRLERECPG